MVSLGRRVPTSSQTGRAARTRHSLPRVLSVLVLLAGLVVAPAATSRAHSELVSTAPAAGSTATTAPRTVTLTFSDEVNPTFVNVTLSVDGRPPVVLAPTVSGRRVDAAVAGSASEGGGAHQWKVVYRIVSADGHPVSGEYAFTVAAPATTTSTASTTSTTPATTATSPTPPATSTPVPTSAAPGPVETLAPAAGPVVSAAQIPVGWVAVAVLLLLVLAGGGWWWTRRRTTPPPGSGTR